MKIFINAFKTKAGNSPIDETKYTGRWRMDRSIFPKSFVEEVRTASDIVAVVSDYVRLKKMGQNYVGLCPFHNEDTPSFTVNRQRQMFYCFGCNVGGDVFEFIKRRETVDFPGAVRLLAERAHLPPPQLNPAAKSESRSVKNCTMPENWLKNTMFLAFGNGS